jgi:hypothetical protein
MNVHLDDKDERFAWRMFSPLGQRVKCNVVHAFVNGTVLPVNRSVSLAPLSSLLLATVPVRADWEGA